MEPIKIDQLMNWISYHKVERRTFEGFWLNYRSYQKECPDEYNKVFGNINEEDLELYINTISLNLGNWPECSYSTVTARLSISIKNKSLGEYRLVLNLDGTDEDDFFIID